MTRSAAGAEDEPTATAIRSSTTCRPARCTTAAVGRRPARARRRKTSARRRQRRTRRSREASASRPRTPAREARRPRKRARRRSGGATHRTRGAGAPRATTPRRDSIRDPLDAPYARLVEPLQRAGDDVGAEDAREGVFARGDARARGDVGANLRTPGGDHDDVRVNGDEKRIRSVLEPEAEDARRLPGTRSAPLTVSRTAPSRRRPGRRRERRTRTRSGTPSRRRERCRRRTRAPRRARTRWTPVEAATTTTTPPEEEPLRGVIDTVLTSSDTA